MLLLYQVDQGDALAALQLRHQPPEAVHRLRRLRPALLPWHPWRTVAGMICDSVTETQKLAVAFNSFSNELCNFVTVLNL